MKTERDKVAHLLRRFAFGASEIELDYYAEGGLSSAISKLLDYDKVAETVAVRPSELTNGKQGLRVQHVQMWWFIRMLTTDRPLEERMTLFWHDHFATSAMKVTIPASMLRQNEILREGATGSFRDLLREVSKDPAMLFWLDNQTNVKGKPNENFAREVMELFTLGVGNYTEQDVQSAARAFTGWTFRAGNNKKSPGQPKGNGFLFRADQHDNGIKTVLGQTGNLDGDAVIDLLCEQTQCHEYICRKLWEYFAYPNPEAHIVKRLANAFRASKLNIAHVLRSIMESPEFYSEKAERALYKSPIDFCVPTLRQLGVSEIIKRVLSETNDSNRDKLPGKLAPIAALNRSTKAMGMELLFPPDVSGWAGGASWISSATVDERIKWADRIFGATRGAGPSIRYPSGTLFAPSETPAEIADRLVSIFDVQLPAAKREQLRAAAVQASASAGKNDRASAVCNAVARLLFATPEFQFS